MRSVRHRSAVVGSTPDRSCPNTGGNPFVCVFFFFLLTDPEERAVDKRSGWPSVPGIRGPSYVSEPSRAPVCCACVCACMRVCLWAEGRSMSLWASTSPVCVRGDHIKARRCEHTRHRGGKNTTTTTTATGEDTPERRRTDAGDVH